MNDPAFEVGESVVCWAARGYWFTTGKEYTVIRYDPPLRDTHGRFTWPAYVQVQDDEGKIVTCHANRFMRKEESDAR